ncbi:MAG: class I SAM-dependent methyltransferase [Desulfobacterales bacterium]
MQPFVCPFWMGYVLLNPLRKLFEHPDKLLGPFVEKGMLILEPGCGMGFFTLPLARMTGPLGKIIAVDVQDKMISTLRKRARKAGLLSRMDLRVAKQGHMGLEDVYGTVDLVAAIHMVHEVPDRVHFFRQIADALKPGGTLFIAEPKGHVSRENFSTTIAVCRELGFKELALNPPQKNRTLLQK